MNDTTKPAQTPTAPAEGSGTVKVAYRVHLVLLRTGTMITTGAMIQAREVGKRTWMPVNIGGVPLVYRSRQTAERHCGWLKDPVGTEPEWGRDESPNTQVSPGPLT